METANRPNQPRCRITDLSSPNHEREVAFSPRFLARSFALFLGIFLSTLVLGTAIQGPYARLFRNFGNALVGLGSEGTIWFEAVDGDPNHDVRLVVSDAGTRQQYATMLSSRRHGYMPTAFFVALALVTPIPWRRRLGVMLMGFAVVQVYIVAKLAVLPFAYGPAGAGGSTVASLLQSVLWVLGATSVGWALVPALIWFGLMLPRLGLPASR